MCGLAGVISKRKLKEREINIINKIADELAKRVGGSYGFWKSQQGNLFFTHQRLAFTDISDLGNQPMHYDNLSIVFNGEVYNYMDLKKELLNLGYVFISNSDTEVVLKAFHKWGESAVKRFNGEFAIAIWNESRNELFLARDRYGIRSMYYFMYNECFWFGSDMKAMYRYILHTNLNKKALNYYFSLQTVIPESLCIVDGYKKLIHGHWAKVQFGANGTFDMKIYKYYEITIDNSIQLGEREIISLCKEEILKSLRRRVEGNGKLGIWLSGGLDSSLITAMCIKNLGLEPETFSVGFNSVKNQCGDEFKYSRYVVKIYKPNHHEIFINDSEIVTTVKKSIEDSYEPMMSNDYIGHYLLGKYTKCNDIKKVLSGVGADEIWYGYDWHNIINSQSDNYYDLLNKFFVEYNDNFIKNILVPEYYIKNCLNNFINNYTGRRNFVTKSDVIKFDINYIMTEDPIKRADIAGMSHGVEVRTPFLDHELVNISMHIDSFIKHKKGIGKYILKKIAEEYFDHDFIYRKKGYFEVPQVKYTSGDIGEFCKSVISSHECRNRGIYNNKFLDSLLQKDIKITSLGGNILWQIANLEYWLQLCNKSI